MDKEDSQHGCVLQGRVFVESPAQLTLGSVLLQVRDIDILPPPHFSEQMEEGTHAFQVPVIVAFKKNFNVCMHLLNKLKNESMDRKKRHTQSFAFFGTA